MFVSRAIIRIWGSIVFLQVKEGKLAVDGKLVLLAKEVGVADQVLTSGVPGRTDDVAPVVAGFVVEHQEDVADDPHDWHHNGDKHISITMVAVTVDLEYRVDDED